MTDVVILIPSFKLTGPIKGAVAIANLICANFRVAIVCIDQNQNTSHCINKNVEILHLHASSNDGRFLTSLTRYRKILKLFARDNRVISISMCFTPDLINAFCGDIASTVSSIRGNLYQNYHFDYGWKGQFIAFIHLYIQKYMSVSLAMNESMAQQIRKVSGRTPIIIPNFIDEDNLEKFRKIKPQRKKNTIRLLFLGSLSERKRPELLISLMKDLKNVGLNVTLDYVGRGNLKNKLMTLVEKAQLSDVVNFRDFVDPVGGILQEYDLMILPSLSEGIPRAAMECLFLGIPCVLRDVDGNGELVKDNKNGTLFNSDENLQDAVISAFKIANTNKPGRNLLPKKYRKSHVELRYLNLIQSLQDKCP